MTARRPLRIAGARLLDAETPDAPFGDLLIEDGRIAAVLPPGAPGPEAAERLDASGCMVIPGLVNAHTHSHLAFAKGVHDRWTLELHLNHGPWTNALLTPEDRYVAAQLGAVEMLTKGCTAAVDLHNEIPMPSPEGIAAAAQGHVDAGMRVQMMPMLADTGLWGAIPGLKDALPADLRPRVEAIRFAGPEALVEAMRRVAADWPFDADTAPLGLAPTIPLHCSDGLMRAWAELSAETGLRTHMHLAESKVQAVAGLSRYGESLTARVDAAGLLNERFTAAHAVWVDDTDLDRIAARGAAIAHNPGSNLRLGSGLARARRMLERGITVGLGTDASSCADGLNMFEAMRTAALISHAMGPDPERWLTAREVLRMATEDGAASMGFGGRLGRIAPGYLADFVFLDLRHVNYLPLNDPLVQMLFVENGAAVKRVMVGGRTVVEDGTPTLVDLDRLRTRVETTVERIRATVGERKALAEALAPHTAAFCQCLAASPFPFTRYGEFGP